MLTLVAGMSVYNVINRQHSTLRVGIKWPNDILINGRKCAGILLESSIGAEKPQPEADRTLRPDDVVILGIGINVNQTTFDADIEETATSLLLETGQMQNRTAILVDVLAEIERQLDIFMTDSSGFVEHYEAALEGMGKMVQLNPVQLYAAQINPMPGIATESPDLREPFVNPEMSSPITGTISGITDDGALRLLTNSGERILYAGEVTFNNE
jgi:BirA family biotin operon repressor/biotin-[acetyl-CoA-carboxylase] ligase